MEPFPWLLIGAMNTGHNNCLPGKSAPDFVGVESMGTFNHEALPVALAVQHDLPVLLFHNLSLQGQATIFQSVAKMLALEAASHAFVGSAG